MKYNDDLRIVGSDQDSSKIKKMGVMERLEWMNTCSKKQCRSLFWRMRAAMKKAVKNKHTFFVALYGGTKKQFNFQYDPSSYALNFDDGTHDQHHHDHYFFHVDTLCSKLLPFYNKQAIYISGAKFVVATSNCSNYTTIPNPVLGVMGGGNCWNYV
ncbi:hypothetical protein CTI12_AA377180 [Artemisia annua]|uniref:Uncharacterized protein n=1 Tax=Artemisia annua TaxID=35608 RepID=A0A2U1MIN8_ARTAN|nr:hypothetical protein CTI12_AA377180 [Artemisia annua]